MLTKKEFLRQILAGLPAFCNEVIMGFGYGWVAPTLRLLHKNTSSHLSLTSDQASWIASLNESGRFIGPIVVDWLLNCIGRKGVLGICSISFVCSWILIAFSESILMIYAARLIFGIAVGMNDVTSAIYLCENFKPHIRGIFGSICTACFLGGVLIEFILVNSLPYRTVLYTNTIISFLAISNMFVSTESVHYLISKKRYERAYKNFLWLRGRKEGSEKLEGKFEKLRTRIEAENKEEHTIKAYLSTPRYRKGIAVVGIFCIIMALTGSSVLNYFVSVTFNGNSLTANEFTILFGAFMFCSAVFSSTIIEKLHRHTILITSFLCIAVVHAATAALFYYRDRISFPHFPWWIFTTITLYAMLYSSGVLPIFYTFRGEILPQHVRPFGNTVAILGHSLAGFITSKVFLLVAESFGLYWNFVFYSVMSVIGAFFVYFILPETMGKSLEEIEDALRDKIDDSMDLTSREGIDESLQKIDN